MKREGAWSRSVCKKCGGPKVYGVCPLCKKLGDREKKS